MGLTSTQEFCRGALGCQSNLMSSKNNFCGHFCIYTLWGTSNMRLEFIKQKEGNACNKVKKLDPKEVCISPLTV